MSLLQEAKSISEIITGHRRYIHEHAEVHLDLPRTTAYVKKQLKAMGYEPQDCGACGIVAVLAGPRPGKAFLLRADMDALPIREESGCTFRSRTGNMHACGHDLHTAMLLGAARLLMDHRAEIAGTVKLMFQPAEETLSGARMMIENGVLENPPVDAALMMHVESGRSLPAGSVIILDPVSSYVAADWFRIDVAGKGCHGAMPHDGVDPLSAVVRICSALQTIVTRETPPDEMVVLTVGQIHGGNTSNIIPDTAFLSGTLRTENEKTRAFARQRIEEIAGGIAGALRAGAKVTFEQGCPAVKMDPDLNRDVRRFCEDVAGREQVYDLLKHDLATAGLGSEDFACIAQRVPAVCLSLAAGKTVDGVIYPIHHPKVEFDESVLPVGAAIFAGAAISWLEEQAMDRPEE